MKLGEAIIRLEHIEQLLQVYEHAIQSCPQTAVVKMLEESNELIRQQHELRGLIRSTEEATLLEGSPLDEVRVAREILGQKIAILNNLAVRNDLELHQRVSLFEQLKSFRASRDALDLSIKRCAWETELLGE